MVERELSSLSIEIEIWRERASYSEGVEGAGELKQQCDTLEHFNWGAEVQNEEEYRWEVILHARGSYFTPMAYYARASWGATECSDSI